MTTKDRAEPTANGGLPSLYAQYIHASRYARWDDSLGRREFWPESVERLMGFMKEKAYEHGYTLTKDEYNELYGGIYNAEAMGSMRALMTAGPAARKDNICIYNCFAFDTKILTIDGLKPIGEIAGTTQFVLDGDGEWTPAPIRSFGRQKVQQITFRPGIRSRTKMRHVVTATPDHRWLTANRGEVTDLQVGDVVDFVSFSKGLDPNAGDLIFSEEPSRAEMGFVRGLGFGDGTLETTGQAKIRLCGEKSRNLVAVASVGGGSTCYPPSAGGDPVHVFHKGVMSDWKDLPRGEDPLFLAGWLDGYIEADGHWNADGESVELWSQDAAALEFVKEIAPVAGLMVTGESQRSNMETNFGTRSAPLKSIKLRPQGQFKVLSVEDADEEEVFCATVPSTQSFVLEHGILTGNCTYQTVDHPRAFDETMYLLMCGTGVGFSVERQVVKKLPVVPEELTKLGTGDGTIVVDDSREGWASSFRRLLSALWSGYIPTWDTSRVRPAGAPLKTFGGRASGPAPLEDLFRYTISIFREALGRRLTSLECHGIMTKIGDVVVAGGVRRSAMISLSNPSDDRMRDAKSGQWWEKNPHYALANNSAAWTEKPDSGRFMDEWIALYKSQSGERGIVNREALISQVEKTGRRKTHDPDGNPYEFGVNPCGEIILRPQQCCNLSEVVARAGDTLDDLMRKVRLATILGTIQAACTDFTYLRSIWRENCEDERLLGVSITGQMDHPVLAVQTDESEAWMGDLKQHALQINREWAGKLGISPATAVTCQKPSGTVSQLVDAASGGHTRHAAYYVRRTRDSNLDPIAEVVRAAGVPQEPSVSSAEDVVTEWPIKAPEDAILDLTAIEQCERWLHTQRHWCEHNPSATITVRESEWMAVGAFVYEHFDEIGGLSFLPDADNHIYQQAPYEEITQEEYEQRIAAMPASINWNMLGALEHADNTTGSQEYACIGPSCELPDQAKVFPSVA
jgi:ribonucleoside-triphosphate reductase